MSNSYINDEYRNKRMWLEKILYNKQEYDICIRETKDFISLLRKNPNASDYNYLRANLILSIAYNNLNRKEMAILYAKESDKYLEKYNNIASLVLDSKWQHAMCYKVLNNKKAKIYFDESYNIAENNKMYLDMALLLEEIGVIEEDTKKIEKAVSLINEKVSDIEDTYKQNTLDSMFSNLYRLYIKNKDEFNSRKSLNKIKNKGIVKQLELEDSKLA